MQTSELFLKFVRRIILAFFILLSWVAMSRAQNAGNVGIYTREINVFTNQNTTKSSANLPDFGFGQNLLSYTTDAFTGTIDLEWSPNPATIAYITLQSATYINDNTGPTKQHALQVGGFFPNMRSTVTVIAGSVSAWYTAQAGPISYIPAAIGSNGPTSPIQCDLTAPATTIATGNYVALSSTLGRGLAVCGFTISFLGTTSAATSGVQVGYGATCSSGAVFPWFLATTANTPQIVNVIAGFGALWQVPTNATALCIGNNSGSSLEIAISFALL